jgi:HK97 family phage portal protein
VTPAEILHIRGHSPNPGAIAGISLLQQHRDPLGSMVAMQRFEGDYFRNNAQPPFFFTGAQNRQHAQDLLDLHNATHQGVGNQGKVGALWGPTDVKALPISMADAAYADAKRLSIEDACRIWRWPRELLELPADGNPPDENAWTARFLKFYLLPRLKRIERGFAADPDLFSGQPLYGEFLTAALERADFVTRVRGYKDARQGGWITGNEIRQLENLPPLEGGDELLVTPTGSAPNEPNPQESQ